jgi:hypothetical protein
MPKATHLPHYVSFKTTHSPLFAKPTSTPKRCTLGNGVALASTDARSDHAVLELFGYFFF